MNYFIDEDLGGAITGIEKAEFNRLNLFRQLGLPAKIVYLTYKPEHHEYAKKFGILGSSFTMFDFFQDALSSSDLGGFDWRNYWEKTCGYQLEFVEKVADVRVYDETGLFIMYASFFDSNYSKLNYINYFDKDHNKIRRDLYDIRGFLSATCLLRENNLLNAQLFFSPDGRIKMIEHFLVNNGTNYVRDVSLKDYKNQDYYFKDIIELRTFFLDELYQTGDVFLPDRVPDLMQSLEKVISEAKIIPILHSSHLRAGEDVVTGRTNYGNFEYTLEHSEKLAKIIVSTVQQKKDLEARYGESIPPVAAIPVGFALPRIEDQTVFEKRNPHRIISVARYSPEKQLLHQVKAVERVIPDFPDVELHLLGYGGFVGSQLRQYIEDHHLEKNIFLRGFHKDLTSEYQQGSLSLMTSTEEGFSLATLESLSFSVPVIAYNINYGPKEMIVDGKNGFLIRPDDQEALYQKLLLYLGNRDLQLSMMKSCNNLLAKYSTSTLMSQWQKLICEVQKD